MNKLVTKGIVILVGGFLLGLGVKTVPAKAATEENIKTHSDIELEVNISREDGINIVPSQKNIINTNMPLNFEVNTDVVKEVYSYEIGADSENDRLDSYINCKVRCQYSISRNKGRTYGEWIDMPGGDYSIEPGEYGDGLYYIRFRKLQSYVLNEDVSIGVISDKESRNETHGDEESRNGTHGDEVNDNSSVSSNAIIYSNGESEKVEHEAENEKKEKTVSGNCIDDSNIKNTDDEDSAKKEKSEDGTDLEATDLEATDEDDTNIAESDLVDTHTDNTSIDGANTDNTNSDNANIGNTNAVEEIKKTDKELEQEKLELEYELAAGIVKNEPVHEIVSESYGIRFDTTEPYASLKTDTNIDGWSNRAIRCTLRVNDTGSRLSSVKVTCDDQVISEYNYSEGEQCTGGDRQFTVDREADDVCGSRLVITTTDRAGNENVIEKIVYIDKTRPEIELSGVEDGKVYDSSTELKISGKDKLPELVTVNYLIRYRENDVWQIINEGSKTLDEICGQVVYRFNRDGDFEVSCYACDRAGNKTDELRRAFRIDKQAPSIKYVGIDDGEVLNDNAGLTINASDNFKDDYKVLLSGSVNTGKVTKQLELSDYVVKGLNSFNTYYFKTDGDYDITAKVEDSAGNTSEKNVSFTIDTVAPVISVSKGISAGSSQVLNEAPTIGFKITESNYETATVTCELQKKKKIGGYEKCETPEWVLDSETSEFNLSVEEEGTYELSVTCVDDAGNASCKKIDFTVDTSSPTIDYLDGLDKKYVKSFKLPDNFSEYIKDTSNVSFQTYINSKNYNADEEIKEDGKYILKVTAVDDAGNQSDKTVEFIVDSTLPRLVIDGMDDEGNVGKDDVIVLSLYDADDYFTSVKIDGVEQLKGEHQQTVEIMIPEYGDYKIEIEASDKAENILTETIDAKCYSAAPLSGKTATIKNLRQAENPGNNKIIRIVMIVLTVIILVVTIVWMSIYLMGNSEER